MNSAIFVAKTCRSHSSHFSLCHSSSLSHAFPLHTAAQLTCRMSSVVIVVVQDPVALTALVVETGTLWAPDVWRAERHCRSAAFSSLSLSSAAWHRSAQS